MSTLALLAAWAAATALPLLAYLAVSRKMRRDRDELLHSLAVPSPPVMILRFPGSAGCSHFTIGGGVTQAACALCGPLAGVSRG